MSPARNRSPGCALVIALRSAPAQNAPPAPVSTQTRMPGSLSVASQASRIRAIIGPVSALRAAGRFIVTISTGPRRSRSACGGSWSGRSPVSRTLVAVMGGDFPFIRAHGKACPKQ